MSMFSFLRGREELAISAKKSLYFSNCHRESNTHSDVSPLLLSCPFSFLPNLSKYRFLHIFLKCELYRTVYMLSYTLLLISVFFSCFEALPFFVISFFEDARFIATAYILGLERPKNSGFVRGEGKF